MVIWINKKLEVSISYKKVGAIRFVKLGRFGFSFWAAKKTATRAIRVPVSSKAFSGDCWQHIRLNARDARVAG